MLPPRSPPVLGRPCTPFLRFVHRKHTQKHVGVNLAFFYIDERTFSELFQRKHSNHKTRALDYIYSG